MKFRMGGRVGGREGEGEVGERERDLGKGPKEGGWGTGQIGHRSFSWKCVPVLTFRAMNSQVFITLFMVCLKFNMNDSSLVNLPELTIP